MAARVLRVGAALFLLACMVSAVTAAPLGATGKRKPAAEIRIVELYAPPDGSQPSIVLIDNKATSGKRKPKPLLEAEFGEVTEFRKVPTGHQLRLAPSDLQGTTGSLFIDPLKKGDRLTLIPYASSDDPEQSGLGMFTIVEHGKRRKAGDVAEWPKVSSSRATLMVFPGGVLSVVPNTGFFLVTPGTGCLENEDPSRQESGSGGNVPAFYLVDPGAVEVGLTVDGCNGSPVAGLETVDASAGDRIVLLPHGASPTDLSLLVLPVDKP